MTRAERIEEAARAMAAIWDRATMEGNSRTIANEMGHDNYRAMFDEWSKLRAALAQPATGGDEYRRGVEDAARVCAEVICEITKPVAFVNHATLWPTEILRRILALSPPPDTERCEHASQVWTKLGTGKFDLECERCGLKLGGSGSAEGGR